MKRKDKNNKDIFIGLIIVLITGFLPFFVIIPTLRNLLDAGTVNLINRLWESGALAMYFMGAIFVWMIYIMGKRKEKDFSKFVKNLSWNVAISYSTAFSFYMMTRTQYDNTFGDNTILVFLVIIWSMVWLINKKVSIDKI